MIDDYITESVNNVELERFKDNALVTIHGK